MKHEKIRMVGEKLRQNYSVSLVIALSVTAALFIFAALIPLAFKGGSVSTKAEISYGEKSAVFARYWNGDKSGMTVEQISSPGKKYLNFCDGIMKNVIQSTSIDKAETRIESEGSEYTAITTAEGVVIKVCRMWMQSQGDWRNWIDVCFDMDTGEMYYLYLSNECVFNAPEYVDALESDLDTSKIADYLAQELDYELRYLDWSGEPSEPGIAVFVSEGSAICMEISCIYYKSTLLDIRISCT